MSFAICLGSRSLNREEEPSAWKKSHRSSFLKNISFGALGPILLSVNEVADPPLWHDPA